MNRIRHEYTVVARTLRGTRWAANNDLLRERATKGKRLAVNREQQVVIASQKNILHTTLLTACAFILPLVGNRVSDEFNWTVFDFVIWGMLVFGAGLTYQLLVSRTAGVAFKAAAGIAVMTAFLLVWINLAVGIIGDGPANLMYFGVPLVGLIGAAIARLRPHGMARALFATALAMALIPVFALIFGTSDFRPGVLPVFIINSVFVLLFSGSAMLFQRAIVAPGA